MVFSSEWVGYFDKVQWYTLDSVVEGDEPVKDSLTVTDWKMLTKREKMSALTISECINDYCWIHCGIERLWDRI